MGLHEKNTKETLSLWMEQLRPFLKKEYEMEISGDHLLLVCSGETLGCLVRRKQNGRFDSAFSPYGEECSLCDQDLGNLIQVLVRYNYAELSPLRLFLVEEKDENL